MSSRHATSAPCPRARKKKNRVLTGVRDVSFRGSSQKSGGMRMLRDARVERNCLVKLSSVMIAVLAGLVLGVGDAGFGS